MGKEKDRWPELCEFVENDDGLPTRPARYWTEDKLYFWNTYIHITTAAMVGKPAWSSGLVYVDLFGGPGVCTLRSGKRVPGSPLIAAYARKPFSKIIVCERKRDFAEACRRRLAASGTHSECRVFAGDCNSLIDQVVPLIPDRALTLGFIDPTGLHAKFDTIRRLSSGRRLDLLLLFADRQDIVRNVELYDLQGPGSNLDQVLGPHSDWRDHWRQLRARTPSNICELFARIYKRQLECHLAYKVFAEESMPVYRLIFASKHRQGLDFWKKATRRYAGGQRRFPW
jgi:three-Cys-motif partner protein